MNRRTIILLIFFIVFAVVLILNGTLFLVDSIEFVDYKTGQSYQSELYAAEDLITASKLSRGMNIFTVSEAKATESLTAAFPKLKVVNIERQFPNKIVIYLFERYPMYAVESGDVYIIVDREGRILETVESLPDNITLVEGLAIDYETTGIKLKTKDYSADRLIALGQAFELYDYIDSNFTQIISRIEVMGYSFSLYTKTGVELRLNVASNLNAKIREILSWYNSDDAEQKRYSGTLTVYDDGEGGYLKPVYTATK